VVAGSVDGGWAALARNGRRFRRIAAFHQAAPDDILVLFQSGAGDRYCPPRRFLLTTEADNHTRSRKYQMSLAFFFDQITCRCLPVNTSANTFRRSDARRLRRYKGAMTAYAIRP
jgi:hypothetical protein